MTDEDIPIRSKMENHIDLNLLANAFDNPQDSFKIIHVAGTNGKGSTSLKVAAGLQALGYKTGLFTSPHIDTFSERI
jgi:dihydrofolate synthase / folylpolyglutamate synthase